MLGLWFGAQLLSGLLSAGGGPGGVAFWAHVGGFVTGIVLLLAMRPRGLVIWQPPRGGRFSAASPRQFVGRHTFHGSVPDAGPPRFRPWD